MEPRDFLLKKTTENITIPAIDIEILVNKLNTFQYICYLIINDLNDLECIDKSSKYMEVLIEKLRMVLSGIADAKDTLSDYLYETVTLGKENQNVT